MIYLTGVAGPIVRQHVDNPRLGLLVQPDSYGPGEVAGWPRWAADNGCFAKGSAFDELAWLRWLNSLPREGCMFAVAPDVVGDAAATLERSAGPLSAIRRLGFPAALVAQDGLTTDATPWSSFDVLFTGGTTEWKLSAQAYELAAEAKARGKRTHMGRVNSWPRIKAAAAGGYDSADGTILAFGPDTNMPRVLGWLARLDHQPFLA